MTSFMNTKMTDRSVAASCTLGSTLLGSSLRSVRGTGLSVISTAGPATLATLPVRERNERPTQAPVARTEAQAQAYGFAAAGAGIQTKQTQHHLMWAFRGLEPWSDPA
ncbi:hypothetical protein [Streptomyces bambusae]|uniref:Uncharacterized protein n=1 Tax=Streptomyces bambusae TaxID=1550616 RepID=A0ABS6Z9R9_9ACTN|nr:hypothetical protein [Streptomyces bambusae]MBW5484513.1 hypothetical protein [Streptomyces bambusae]